MFNLSVKLNRILDLSGTSSNPISPEVTSTTPPTTNPPKKDNKLIIIPVLILVIILGAFAYSYFKTSADLKDAAESAYKTMGYDYKISNLSIFPPSADFTMLFYLNNPSTYDLELNIELTLFYNNAVLLPVKGAINLPAGKSGTLECLPFHVGTESLSKFNEKEKISTSATIVATTKVWGLLPVSYTKTATNLQGFS